MNKSYYSVLISQVTTNLGFSLYTMTVILFLHHLTDSTFLTSLVTLVSILARMLGSTMLPLFSTKLHFQPLLLLPQIMQFTFLLILLFLLTEKDSPALIFLTFSIIGVVSFFNGWFSPLKTTMIRVIVPSESRIKANSLLSTVDQTFQFIGWSFGGFLLAFLGKESTLVFTLSLILISMISLLCIGTVYKSPYTLKQESFTSSLFNGWQYLFTDKKIRVLIIMDLIESWAGVIWIGAISLAFVQEALHKGETWWGYINGAYYLGSMIGGFLIYRMSIKLNKNLMLLMLLGASSFGFLTLSYGVVSSPTLALILVLSMDPSYILRDLCQETIFQNAADGHTLTKIMAARSTLVQFIFLLAIIGTGLISEMFSIRFVYIVAGILLLASVIYGFSHFLFQSNRTNVKKELDC
ncbi:MFS transporter [Priestia filamentosa]|uniref:MFS transporter n=1 Tax=Priestia filamentosa TaxID=1402861 RepID=A0A0H4KGZ1_9BACI|nr:MFS transporter [Priestia filamentosa]AKO92076.1 MFS transporter [Priestia filamentosa]